ncbi:MAG: HPr family phosphocarrier protein [Butyricicoccus sp.]
MKTFMYTITDPQGLHARPAGMLVKKAKEFPCTIKIEKDGKSADARKMFGLMGLGIQAGQTVTVTTEGLQEEKAAAALEVFMKENL